MTVAIRCLLGFGMLFVPMIARANTNTMTMDFTGVEGNISGGVYTYPYNFTINGSGNYPLMCTTFTREITDGEQWPATTLAVGILNSVNVQTLEFPSAGVTGYLEASYLFMEEVNAYKNGNTDPEGLYNWAVWDLFTGTDPSGSRLSSSEQTKVQGYLSAAEALGNGGSLTPMQFSDVVIYTPVDTGSNGPQELMGYDTPEILVPEPGTLVLVGFGVLGLAGVLRRKLIR